MIPYDELTPLQKLRSAYSDIHKDITGFRPDYEKVDSWSEQQLKEQFDILVKYLKEQTNAIPD